MPGKRVMNMNASRCAGMPLLKNRKKISANNMDKKLTIDVTELQEKLEKNEPVYILDIRPADQRREWRISESRHVDVYEKLKNGDVSAFDNVQIPDDATVVTVCAAGKTSMKATEALRAKGVKALSLKGGMKAWNFAWNTASMDITNARVIQVRRPAKGVLSYVIGSGNDAIVIDASLDPEVYLSIAKSNDWTIRYVIDTHVHADFVSRTRELAEKTIATHLFTRHARVDYPFKAVDDNEVIKVGDISVKALHTPGHTWESTSFLVNNEVLITGDTLFVDGIGRPDLKAEKAEAEKKAGTLYRTIIAILAMDHTLFVLPGHTSGSISFDATIIGDTLENIKSKIQVPASEESFVKLAAGATATVPPNYEAIVSLNKKGTWQGEELSELEAGGNHCAIA
jgi:glyoxylase-like metal-dependent hydrolase (beta-lactamase superfamily II)/rhodanese-related sulfurtransferase